MEPMQILKAGTPATANLKSLQPESISADKAQMPWLICQQLDRINFLLTIGMTATTETRQVADITRGVLFGLRTLESMMCTYDDAKFDASIPVLKENMPSTLYGVKDLNNPVFKYLDALVKKSERFGLIPIRRVRFEFDETEAWK